MQVSLPEQTAEKLQQAAASRGMDSTQLLVQLVEEYLADQAPPERRPESPAQAEQQRKIEREQRHYEAQHAELLALYHGQYIAMHDGKVVDHDSDRVALRRRIRDRYGAIAILITPVEEEPLQTIMVRSPKLVEFSE